MNESEKIKYSFSYYTKEYNKKRHKESNVTIKYVPKKFVDIISTYNGILRFNPESISTTYGKKVYLNYIIKN